MLPSRPVAAGIRKRPLGPSIQGVVGDLQRVKFRMNKRWLGCLVEIVETVLLTAVVFWVVQSFVVQPYAISGFSMENTLQNGQMVLVDKISPALTGYQRGNVIVFQSPPGYLQEGKPTPFIKRLIGLPGDLIQIHDGAVYVNGVKLDEPYVYTDDGEGTNPETIDPQVLASHVCESSPSELTCRVPQGDFFALGDHRDDSADSRVFGPIPKSTVIGQAWLRYWPLAVFGGVESAQYQGIPNASPESSDLPAGSPPPSVFVPAASPAHSSAPIHAPRGRGWPS